MHPLRTGLQIGAGTEDAHAQEEAFQGQPQKRNLRFLLYGQLPGIKVNTISKLIAWQNPAHQGEEEDHHRNAHSDNDSTCSSTIAPAEEDAFSQGSMEDWDSPAPAQETPCLFCDSVLPTPEDLRNVHLPREHGFSVELLLDPLPFYDQVKLVNYMRRCFSKNMCFSCAQEFPDDGNEAGGDRLQEHLHRSGHVVRIPSMEQNPFWQDPQNLFPVMEDDPFLQALGSQDWWSDEEEEEEKAMAHASNRPDNAGHKI